MVILSHVLAKSCPHPTPPALPTTEIIWLYPKPWQMPQSIARAWTEFRQCSDTVDVTNKSSRVLSQATACGQVINEKELWNVHFSSDTNNCFIVFRRCKNYDDVVNYTDICKKVLCCNIFSWFWERQGQLLLPNFVIFVHCRGRDKIQWNLGISDMVWIRPLFCVVGFLLEGAESGDGITGCSSIRNCDKFHANIYILTMRFQTVILIGGAVLVAIGPGLFNKNYDFILTCTWWTCYYLHLCITASPFLYLVLVSQQSFLHSLPATFVISPEFRVMLIDFPQLLFYSMDNNSIMS